MESTSHLVRMAEELKCPICLSLLKSAVSLTCNHIFCNACIDKSMKSDSTCPVCKIPYRRREIRPAPHMDSLVGIYKSMEVSSGVNILITQSERQPTDHENQVDDEMIDRSKVTSKACGNMRKRQNQRKNQTKTLKESSKRSKRCNLDSVGPSFPIKKRVQVPLHHPQETPTRPANPEGKKNELKKDLTQTNISRREGTARLHDNEEALFTPFFWLRNEEDAEKTTQLTPLDPLNGSLPDGPCFSDIKDANDDVDSCHMASKDVDMFDSEMFEWTQKPCSPELYTSPVKMQDEESNRFNRPANNDNMNGGMEIDKLDVVLPTYAKVKGSKKRTKKTGESVQKKRVKKDTNKVVGNCTEPLKADQDKDINVVGNINGLVKCKKRKSVRGRKVSVVTSNIASEFDGTTSNHGDGSRGVEGTGDICNAIGKNQKEATNEQNIEMTKRSKKQDSGNNNISQLPSEPSLIDGKVKACGSRKQIENGLVSKVKTSKKVAFTVNENASITSVKNISSSERLATKESQQLGLVHRSSTADSTSKGKSNITHLLHKCVFCQSTEESDISGGMAHYLKGKPLPLDHEGVSGAIHAHKNCTTWAPNVFFEDDIALNLEAELARSKRIKCSCCGLKGAALGCYEKSCRKSFHFTCAKLTPQCRWDDDNFVMLCPFHSSQKLPNETCGSQLKERKNSVSRKQANIKQSQVPVADMASQISHWDSHGLFSKIILCCSALTTIEKEIIIKFEKLSRVTILKTWDSRVTHVIASVDENGASRRTLKYLMGILEGKWILNIEWVKACLEVKKPVDEQLYEINLDIHGLIGGPKLGRSRILNKEPKLFNGFKFYFTGYFATSYKGYLHDLIIAAGGTMLHRKPIPLNNEMQFLIYNLELPDEYKANEQNLILSKRKSDAQALAKSCGAVAVSNLWILNSISACKLQNLDWNITAQFSYHKLV